jgi:hypothetical protein
LITCRKQTGTYRWKKILWKKGRRRKRICKKFAVESPSVYIHSYSFTVKKERERKKSKKIEVSVQFHRPSRQYNS